MTGRRILRVLGIWPFRWICEPLLWALARRFGREPVPLSILRRVRRLCFGPDPLARELPVVNASALHDGELSELLAGRELGGWTLGADSIEELARVFRMIRPGLVIEFGSGVSTICLAHFASKTSPRTASVRVVAIEQDPYHARSTSAALESAGLAELATVVHAPLIRTNLLGQEYSAYELPADFLSSISDPIADLVLVDGPAAESGARYATLHVVRPWLRPGTVILLDDALRDGELEAARAWESQGLVSVDGVRLIDKGLLAGQWSVS